MPHLPLDLAAVTTVLAYLDPGTGSYVLQMVLAGLFGGLFAIKQSWSGIKVWLQAHSGRGLGADASHFKGPKIHGRPIPEPD